MNWKRVALLAMVGIAGHGVGGVAMWKSPVLGAVVAVVSVLVLAGLAHGRWSGKGPVMLRTIARRTTAAWVLAVLALGALTGVARAATSLSKPTNEVTVQPSSSEPPSKPVDGVPQVSPNAEASSSDDGATAVSLDLGIGPDGAKLLSTISERYAVSARTVGDKAAKASLTCTKGSPSVEKVKAALVFVEGVSREKREMMPLDDAFVTYITMGCP